MCFFLWKRGAPPQEEDAPVECREPKLSLQRKLLHGEGRGRGGCGPESKFQKHRDIWQQIPLHFLSPAEESLIF